MRSILLGFAFLVLSGGSAFGQKSTDKPSSAESAIQKSEPMPGSSSASAKEQPADDPITKSIAPPAASKLEEPVAPFDRLRGLVGIVLILATAFAISSDKRAISFRVVFWGLALQWLFALLVLRVPAGVRILREAGGIVELVLQCALKGSQFVFGEALVAPDGPAGFVFRVPGCCRRSSSSPRSSPCCITWASCNGSCGGSRS